MAYDKDGSTNSQEGRGISPKQIEFITNLEKSSKGGSDALADFLKGKKKGNVSELSSREASELIDKLKSLPKIEGMQVQGTGRNATPKQISFINNLLSRNPSSKEKLEKFLRESKKGSIEELSIPEASKLIDLIK
ncbi:MAG: hypothetical protein ACYCR7_05275 [Thermoplasmataceae archaeon]